MWPANISGKDIQVSEGGNAVVISVAPQEGAVSLRSSSRAERVGAWVTLGFGFLMLLLGCIYVRLAMGGRFTPSALLIVPCSAGMAIVAFQYLWKYRSSFRIAPDVTTERFRRGIVFRTRRYASGAIRRIIVHPPRQTSPTRFSRELSDRPATLLIELDDGRREGAFGRFTHATAHRVAHELASQLNRLRPKPLVGFATGIEVCDAMDRKFLDAAENTVSRNRRIYIEQGLEGQTIHDDPQPTSFRSYFLNPIVWFGLLYFGLVLCMYLLARTLPPTPERTGGGRIVWVAAIISAVIITTAVRAARARTSFQITPDHLVREIRKGRSRSIRRWDRALISGIWVEYRVNSHWSVRPVLELEMTDRSRQTLGSGSVFHLRYIATLLRSALGLEVAAAADNNPDEPQWHLQDEPELPAHSQFVVTRRDDAILIQKSRPGAGCTTVFVLLMGVPCLVFAAVLALVARFCTLSPETLRAVLGIAILCAAWGILCIFAVLWDAHQSAVLEVRNGSLAVTLRSLFGVRRNQWTCEELAAIRTAAAANPYSANKLPLIIHLRNGKQYNILSGRPNDLRHVATLLRHKLKVPATLQNYR